MSGIPDEERRDIHALTKHIGDLKSGKSSIDSVKYLDEISTYDHLAFS